MPHNANGVYYQTPVALEGASITPRLVTADVSLPSTPFSLQDAKDLFVQLNVHEHYVTALTGANNDLVYIARTPGGTPTVSITYADPSANNAALAVSVTGEDITVSLATGAAGAITSTSAQIKAAIEAHAAANALVVVAHSGSDTGAGVVTALAKQTLGGPGGTTPTLDVSLKHGISTGTLVANAAFTQVNAAGSSFKSFTGIGSYGQWLLDVGGTTPVFAVSLTAVYRP